MYSVYVHTSPNGKRYVGITSQTPEKRWIKGKGYRENKHFTAAIYKYGWDNIRHDIIAEELTKETACKIEKALIAEYRSNDPRFGYNNSIGGENPSEGHKADEAERKHRSETHKGVKMSERGKQNISNAKKGKPNGKTGKFGADGTRAVMVYQIDPKTQQIIALYFGYAEMTRKTGYAKTPVREAANGIRKRAYGFLWSFAKRGE